MNVVERSSPSRSIPLEEARELFFAGLDSLGKKKKVLLIPPDGTRYHSMAGLFTRWAWEYYGENIHSILPALGTHAPMTEKERRHMFGPVPDHLFMDHRWREDITTLGEISSRDIEKLSRGACSFPWPAQVNRILVEGDHDLILSVGQVVPHEVIGMANHAKNIFVGTGGAEGINKSHFLGAVYGMEKIMGRAVTPVRELMDRALTEFASSLPVYFLLTVIGEQEEDSALRGLYLGAGSDCFYKAAELSAKVNIEFLDSPRKKIVAYLDPGEFKSTWLGNKSVYRSRMAMADGGELIVLAPGVSSFGEDKEIDRLIRRYGYAGTKAVLNAVESERELRENLSAAAHLIHGSSEGRFAITYCPGGLTRHEVEKAGYNYGNLPDMTARYNPKNLVPGENILPGGEEIYYIANPAAGLWTERGRFI